MIEKDFNGEKFDLSQNSFVIFMLSYAPGLITGSILIVMINNHLHLPDIIEYILEVLLFIFMLIKAIMNLQLNKRTLVITDNSIMIYLKKRKNNILLTKINNEDITSIKQLEKEAFVVTTRDGKEEIIALSCAYKPYNILLYSVKAALFKIFGEERTDFIQDKLFVEYTNNKTLPKELLKSDSEMKSTRVALLILYMIFAGIPTALCLLAILLLILLGLMTLLKGVVALLS